MGFQLCAPPGSGDTINAWKPTEAEGNSFGRPVFESNPEAHVIPLTKGAPEMNSPVWRSST
jgi:hypothetical protein